MSSLQTGAPHFKSLMKQYRHANYTLPKVLNEFVDNAIKRATELRILTQVDDTNRLQELRISDNIESGFDSLDQSGVNNPFNMGHIKISHDNDSETSEFGVGMKAGALSAANQLNVYTRITKEDDSYKYFEVTCDFISMSEKEDVNESYNPFLREITYGEYKMNHPFEQGSTIKLSKIRDCIYPRTKLADITNFICDELSATYTRFISKGVNIEVNGNRVNPIYDFFEDPKCVPFTVTKEMFTLEKEGMSRIYLIRQKKELVTWQEYNRVEDKWQKLEKYSDGLACIADLKKNGYKLFYTKTNSDGACLQLNTTFVFYSDMFHRQDGKDHPITDDALLIYKDDRNYGKQSIFTHRNGCNNYTLHEMNFVSKCLGKDIGITFNKEISMNGSNEMIMAITSALIDSKRGFTADTHSSLNTKLCEKAIRQRIINPATCSPQKLAVSYRPESSDNDSESTATSAKGKKPTKGKNAKKTAVVSSSDEKTEDGNTAPVTNTEQTTTAVTNTIASVTDTSIVTEPVAVTETIVIKTESDQLQEKSSESDKKRLRTIEIIVCLQKMLADELELSDESLSIIEKVINA